MVNKVNHFLRRLGFGPTLAGNRNPYGFHVDKPLSQGVKNKSLSTIDKPAFDTALPGIRSEENLKQFFLKNKEESILLNVAWTQQMIEPDVLLREKMTFFWHDHFACRARIPWLAQQQNNTLRTHALGSFADLLMAVAKDPAMIQFLNNQQNLKDSPNENFAREVMELFTLGRGNYTEQDVKEAARAFTGWAFDPRTGEFIFRSRQHDPGIKTFRGKRGKYTGEDIIEQLLHDKQTARYITEKIWSFFVSTDIRDEEIIQSLTSKFYANYDLHQLISSIVSSSWFYENRFVGNRIKSPIELLVGIQLHTEGIFSNATSMAFLQRALGQILFFPPNVSGWPQGREWIDSSSLTFRLSLPGILLRGESSDFQTKDDGDVNNLTNRFSQTKLAFTVNWDKITEQFNTNSSITTLERIEAFLLAHPTTKQNRALIDKYTTSAQSDGEFMQRAYIGFMSLPEYQLS